MVVLEPRKFDMPDGLHEPMFRIVYASTDKVALLADGVPVDQKFKCQYAANGKKMVRIPRKIGDVPGFRNKRVAENFIALLQIDKVEIAPMPEG